MPYATRRISVNLEALGVQLPHSRSSNKPPHSTTTTTASTNNVRTAPPSDNPPAKRVKRSHTLDSASLPSAALPSRPRVRKASSTSERHAVLTQPTPPPSPKHHHSTAKIDKQGINDDIVVAVLEQLEATGNRPHLIKELVAVLINILPVVETSQNPVAIISSRLTNYLKRPWTALAPCPLAKEQVTVHPRRVYYYLTTMHRQEIPEYSKTPQIVRHIISPSISSGPDEESERYETCREQMSPSPELSLPASDDLSLHGMSDLHFADTEFDLPIDEHETAQTQSAQPAQETLEHDEREFSRTAGVMRQRKESEKAESRSLTPTDADQDGRAAFPSINEEPEGLGLEEEDSEELMHQRNQEAAAALFPHVHHHVSDFSSSPMLRPLSQHAAAAAVVPGGTPKKQQMQFSGTVDTAFANEKSMYGAFSSWVELKSPENIELAELDDLLGGY